jgi:hypothetical protein
MILALLLLGFGLGAGANHGLLYERLAERLSAHDVAGKVMAGIADKVVDVRASGDADDEADPDESSEDGPQLEVIPPVPPVPPMPPGPLPADLQQRIEDAKRRAMDAQTRALDGSKRATDAHGKRGFILDFHGDTTPDRALPHFSETGKRVPTVDLLHRIASTAGWSMTLVGSPRETVDIDVKDADPREALRQVLQKSGAMGVLKRDRLVVVASPDSSSAGMLVQSIKRSRGGHPDAAGQQSRHGGKNDIVRVMQGDITVPQGTVVQGDVVCVGGSVELEPGSVVQGDAVAVGGSVIVNEGALVLGQGVAILGTVDVARGAQVMGEHVQVGMGRLFGSRSSRHSWLSGLGPFGLFPTLALFAIVYLLGLVSLRLWPERVRMIGHAMFESPVRSFAVGFLCWLLLLPLVVLLCISLVGIPLVPLLPVAIFLSIVLGLSAFALRIGETLPAGPGQRFVPPAALGMGMAVLMLLAFVPWLGVSLLALLQFFALGSAVSSRFGRALPPHIS